MLISIVVPVKDEQESIKPMFDSVCQALAGYNFEIVFVDDGSSDSTVQEINALNDNRIKLIVFARNYGQTSAIAAGISEASGDYIVTLDGDLQNDPTDIPMMLQKLQNENLDVVAGRRARRNDGFILRKIPSLAANWLIRRTTKVYIRDYGCTLKMFRRDIAKKLDLYGELHRFIPVLSEMYGAKIAEVDVKHHARKYGRSKYGLGRTVRVASDLMLMLFFLRYRQKPMHLFGGIGLISLLLGFVINIYLVFEKLSGNDIGDRPLLYLGVLLIIVGVQFISTGFLAELNMRTYFESQNKKPYSIARKFIGGREIRE